jgi:putative transposase
MSRGRRLFIRNGIYHVMARGNRKGAIFEDARDRERFVDILRESRERHRINIYSECRMGNHYHAVVKTPEANISEFMGYLNGVFAQSSNHRHARTGHLFGERFKPILVDTAVYLRVAVCYVEMNPVAAGLVAKPTDWAWSSCRPSLGLTTAPDYLSLDWLDRAFPSASRAESQQKYREYLAAPSFEEAEALLVAPAVGSPAFLAEVRAHIGATLYLESLPRAYRALSRPPLEALLPRGMGKSARATAMLRAHVVYGYRMSEIARSLDVHPNTVGRAIGELRRRARNVTTS